MNPTLRASLELSVAFLCLAAALVAWELCFDASAFGGWLPFLVLSVSAPLAFAAGRTLGGE